MTHSISTGQESPSSIHLAGWGWFVVWLLAGLVGAIGLVSFGWLALGPAFAISGALIASRTARRSAWGLLSGAGLMFLFVAYVQRDGPGTTCWHTATASGCDQHLDPRPWLVAGVLLLIGGVVGQLSSSLGRRGRER
jgi:hypothetical protein